MVRATKRKLDGYSEVHHIIPRCMGGSNKKENLVRLTSREHFLAHHLLFRIYKSTKLAHAWFSMCRASDGQYRKFSSHQYATAKSAHINAMKASMIGAGNHFYGRKHSDETKKKLRDANLGRKISQERIQWFTENVAKKPKSLDHRKKIGRKNLVTIKNILTGEVKRLDRSLISGYDTEIWKNPSSIKQKREQCIYCNVESVSGNIKRWHNENCKHNPNREA
jgi:hypothetical protein